MSETEEMYGLAPMQESLLYQCIVSDDPNLYTQQACFRIRGDVDPDRVRHAWSAAARRHSILRSGFLWEDRSEPAQFVLRACEPEIDILDWRSNSDADQRGLLAEYLGREQRRGFQLNKPPLYRLSLMQLNDREWVLVFCYHHLIVDGWSLALLMRRTFRDSLLGMPHQGVTDEYNAIEDDRFADFVQTLKARRIPDTGAYWRGVLTGFEPPGKLGFERRRAEMTEDLPKSKSVLHMELSEIDAGLVRQWARRQRVTVSTVLVAAWAIVLARHLCVSDVCIGLATSGRAGDLPDLDRRVGLFMNVLPVRIDVSSSLPVHQWVRAVQRHIAEIQSASHVSLTDIRSWTGHKASGLFDCTVVIFDFDRVASTDYSTPVHEVVLESSVERLHDRFTLTMNPGLDQRCVRATFSNEHFAQEVVGDVFGRLAEVLRDIAASGPERTIGEIEAITSAEREKLLVGWNGPRRELTGGTMLAALVEQADRIPDELAVIDGPNHVTYAQLRIAGTLLGQTLIEHGAKLGDIVGVVANRSSGAAMAMFGAWSAGCAFAPIDSRLPADRQIQLLENLVPVAVLAGESVQQAVREFCKARNTPILEVCEKRSPKYSSSPVTQGAMEREKAAYVIFTSGSTGEPKGVVLSHQGLHSVSETWRHIYRLQRSSRLKLLQIGNFSFDVFTGDLAKVVYAGGTMVVCPEGDKLDFEKIYAHCVAHGINFIESTPGLVLPFVEFLAEAKLDLPNLEIIVVGADYLREEEYKTALSRIRGRFRLINGYGLTEGTIESSTFEAHSPADFVSQSGYVPIGKPFPNVNFYILDSEHRLVPPGITGELYLGGVGVALGYHRQDELSAALFRTDIIDNDRVYKTGDLACWNGRGEVEYFGRIGQMVKLRGYRVEIGEIENALLKFRGINHAAVIPVSNSGAITGLCAFVQTEAPRPSPDVMHKYLSRKLPEYMVPDQIRFLGRMPLNANGKVDRKALAVVATTARQENEGSTPHPAPRTSTPTERQVASVWQELLSATFDADTSFFEAGGNSLLLLKLYNRLRAAFSIPFTIADLFSSHTVRQFAHFIDERSGRPAEDPLRAIVDEVASGRLGTDQALSELDKRAFRGSLG